MNNKLSFEELITKLTPAIQELEAKRSELKQEALRKSSLYSMIVLGLALIAVLITSQFAICGAISLIVIIAVFIIVYNYRSANLCTIYKERIITQLVETLVENGKYEPNTGISEHTFNQSKLFSTPDRYNSEDYISGKIGQTPFCFAEVHAEEKQTQTDSKGRTTTTWSTLFKGFLFIADSNKDFSGQTVINRNSFFNFVKSNRVKLENPEFEKRFDTFSTDQVEARYLLSPAMMERIITLDKKFDSDILVSFCNSTVVIAISNSRNHFETSLWKSLNSTEALREEYNTLISLTSIIETLDLNTRIWSKK